MTTEKAIETTRFGYLEYEAEDVVKFQEGMLGFPGKTDFLIIEHKAGSPFRWLQSIDTGDLAFLVVDPGVYLADYAPEMPMEAAEKLELSEDTPRLVYTIVTIPRGKPEAMTLNLAGPLVINLENRQAKQIVLETDLYPIKFPILQAQAQGEPAA
ncbi:flagellar assembly protein FliW [Kamptonema cortianum]|nr:flagellar assembly protein FliW [Geitlerinema splendidum]MDK3157030.1 flagellar assembly protein FliW [Kamptonema cortianum]